MNDMKLNKTGGTNNEYNKKIVGFTKENKIIAED